MASFIWFGPEVVDIVLFSLFSFSHRRGLSVSSEIIMLQPGNFEEIFHHKVYGKIFETALSLACLYRLNH